MTTEGSMPPAGSGAGEPSARAGVSGVLADLADVHRALAEATSEADILTAVSRGVARYGPASMELSYVHCDASGKPAETEIMAAWAAGAILSEHPLLNVRIDTFGAAPLWYTAPEDIFHVEDVRTDPRLDDVFRAVMARLGKTSVALLSLWSREARRWHGLITLTWEEPHALSGEERLVYEILAQTVTAIVAARRAIAGYKETLEEASALYAASDDLHAATTLEEALRAVARRAIDDEGARCAILGAIEVDAAGAPEWLRITSVIGPSAAARQLDGQRFHVPSYAFSRSWVEDPSGLQVLADVERDERADSIVRGTCAAIGARAVLVLPLLWRMRWIGLILILWPDPRELSQAERRLYRALAGKAAMAVENRLLAEKIKAALADSTKQRVALRTILEHLPVGVLLLDPGTRRLVLRNQKGIELLGLPEKIGEQWGGAPMVPLVPGTGAPIPPAEWPTSRAVATGVAARAEVDMQRRDGSWLEAEITVVPTRDEKGELTSLVTLIQDISERRRAEKERLALQQEIIRAQAAALAERSNPLIPISDDIVVMPLIGSIDAERGGQMLEALLHGVSRARARFAIIDVTGARAIDAQAAGTLLSAARALRLLGVEPVLTGVRAEIAQALIGLRVDFEGVVTLGTLQSGIAYAAAKTRRRGA